MADKRISQLVDRGTVANNDVVPIVVSGASTTNKATISSIQTFMQGNLDLGVTSVGITLGSSGTDVSVSGSPITSSGNITINIPTASATNRGLLSSANWTTFNNKVSSVGLSMPSAFSVANSPITGSGTIAVTGAGTVAQYIRGDGSLADFPSGGGGGGASVNYYLNGSVNQGTIGGIGYYEMNKVPVLGTGTDFVAIADGYLASFITDAGDPALLEIPAGNWNFETYFSASSGGGSPSFYIELYKVNSGGTATLIASNSATPELIAFGTSITPYFSALAVPTTSLTLTDRLALRYYVARSGRTITMHTENSHLCQIITTFTTGLTALNGLTAQVQNFATGTSGTDFAISSSVSTHTFNLPDASTSARGVVTTGAQNFSGNKSFQNTIFANAGVRLDQNGTALPTFVQNISGTGLSTTGANGVGFNNANNFFFAGSDKGCAVFEVNNTGTRNYTLPNASGTIALTSDLGAYLPLVGGTLTGNLNGTTASFENGVNLARTSGNVGIGIDAGSEKLEVFSGSSRLVQKFRTSTNGLTTIYASAGATVGFIGNGLGLFSTATETQFGIRSESDLLLGAGGVPRLTLAAAGGATFTNNVTIGQATAATNVKLIFSGVANKAAGIEFHQGGSPQWYIGNGIASEDNNFELFNSNGTMAMKIIKSTNAINFQGAATFSSSVTAGGSGNVILGVDASYPTYNTIGFGGTLANGQNRIFAGNSSTNDGVYLQSKQGINFWVNGTSEVATVTSNSYFRMLAGSGGIQFNGDTGAANALDDYEEGTWTASLTPITSGTISLSTSAGTYTKIGNQVTITAFLIVSSVSLPIGSIVYISGLPFSIPNLDRLKGAPTVTYFDAPAYTGQIRPTYSNKNSTLLSVVIDASLVGNDDEFYITFSYLI